MKNIGGWSLWFLGLAINGLFTFLWLVFGAAAAGNANASAHVFLWGSFLIAGGIPLISIYFATRERFMIAFLTTFLAIPLLAGFLLLF